MFKIAFLFFLTTVFAKLDKPKYDYILFEVFNRVDEPSYEAKKAVPSAIAWVLSLDRDVEALKLRAASSDEAREVFGTSQDGPNYRQPRMKKESLPLPHSPKKESSDAAPLEHKTTVNEKTMLAEIMRVINKFALTTNNEPDAYLGDDSDKATPTIKLYFKGNQTSLVVRAEGKQWHYIIGPSTVFPDWFYGEHEAERDGRGPFVEVPKHVAADFYAALLHLLTMFLSFPV